MNNLTTRKIVLGMLMALVLAFSVQGIAEALTFRDSRTGDLQTLHPNDDFRITFSVNLNSPKDIFDTDQTPKRQEDETGVDVDSSGYKVRSIEVDGKDKYFRISGSRIVDNSGYLIVETRKDDPRYPDNPDTADVDETRYLEPGDQDRDDDGLIKAKPEDPLSDSLQHHYNDEAIAIVITGGTVSNLKKGDERLFSGDTAPGQPATFVSLDLTEVSLIEETKNRELESNRTLTSSTTLTGQVGAAGVYTIKIVDMTPLNDYPENDQPFERAALTFTLYVVPERDATTLGRLPANEHEFALDRPLQINTFFTSGSNVPLRYAVEGSGSIYPKVTYTDGSPTSEGRPAKTLFTSSAAPVFINMNRGSSKVSVYIQGQSPLENTKSISFIYDYAVLEIIGGDPQVGATSGRLENPLSVKVTDRNRRPVPGLRVQFDNPNGSVTDDSFIPFPDTTVYTTTDSRTLATTQADETRMATASSPSPTAGGALIYVQTDSSGEAKVYYQLGSDETETQDVQVMAAGVTKTFTLDADDDARRASLAMVSMEKATGTGKEGVYYLTVIARSVGGHRIPNVIIEFEALSGSLRPRPGTSQPTENTGSGNEILVNTGSDGEAAVEYNVGPTDSTKVVTAEVHDEQQELDYEFILDRVTFDVQHATSSRPDISDDDDDDTPTPFTPLTLSVDQASITGRPSSTQVLTVTASETAQVGNIVFGEFLNAGGSASPSSGSGTFTTTLTLPSTEGAYNLVVSIGVVRRTVSVTVSSTAAETQTGGRLVLEVPISGAPNSPQTVRVTVIDADGNRVSGVNITLAITNDGGTFSPSRVTTNNVGTATSRLTLGSTAGNNYHVTATASNYQIVEKRISITGTSSDTTSRAAGEPDSIDVYNGDGQRGVPNVRLAEPLVVEVVDANDDPVSNVRVRFRTTIGSGRFSPVLTRTARNGRAQTNFTPTSPGRIRITAFVKDVTARAVFNITAGEAPETLTKVSGDTQSGTPDSALANPFVVEVKDEDGEAIEGLRISFSVTAGGGSLSETSATADEDGRAETTLTLGSERGINSVQASVSGVDPVTFSTSIEPKILVAAANRPVMYWIDNGMLYGLAGAKAAKIAENVNGVAIGGGKVYWTAPTGERGGTVNSANLDGDPDVTELASIFATPVGIAVDTDGSKLYWTNASGRIQSANLDGSRIQNVLQNLSNPTDIVVSNGFIYWTEDGNTIRRVNSSGQKIVIDVAVNLDTVGGLAVGGGKVYWTEQTSATAGTVNGANLNGTNFETLATLLSAPMGISVDTAGSKLYWTNARGRVQSANLDGSRIKNVVEGLISASKLAIGGANVATVATKPTTPKADTSDYDVDNDGKVDNTDAALVAGAMNTGDAKYDVNDDGAVNFLDLLLVFDNRDPGAAAAPTIVGMQLNAVQIDRIEEQIDLLLATNDRSPAAMRTLVYLQQLLATARPEKTQLFANYPNPFNPETWIPYELATDTHVTITIYNTQGVVIRTLQFGHQSAGYYTGRDRAAYWDGRNALGEQVASGLYFYQLETDEMSSMRKMVILK